MLNNYSGSYIFYYYWFYFKTGPPEVCWYSTEQILHKVQKAAGGWKACGFFIMLGSKIPGLRQGFQVSGVSDAAGRRDDQFDQKTEYDLAYSDTRFQKGKTGELGSR